MNEPTTNREALVALLVAAMVCAALLLSRLAHGAEAVACSAIEETASGQPPIANPQSIIPARCPNGACPVPYAPLVPRPFSPPIRNPQSSIHNLSAAAFDTVVKVQADNGYGGSGVLVDCAGQAVILTAAHVVRGAATAAITFRDGQQFRSREILVDRDGLDLAAMLIAWPRRIQPARLGEMPRSGEPVMACGYGPEDTLAGLPNTIRGVRFSLAPRGGAEADSLEMLGTFRSGDSGGPVFDSHERLVAIINASSAPGAAQQSNVAVACRPIRAFLERLRERNGERRGEKAERGRENSQLGRGAGEPEQPEAGCGCDSAAVLKKLEQIKAEGGMRNAELAGKLDELMARFHERLSSIATRGDVGAVAGAQEATHSELKNLKDQIASRAPAVGWTLGQVVAGALGISGPLGLGIAAAGWIVGRRVRLKVGNRRSEVGASVGPPPDLRPPTSAASDLETPTSKTVILETPPPPQVVERGQQYVPYQAPNVRLEAIERAMAEYVRRYPSAAGVLETINAYADQFQSGEKKN